MGLHRQSLGDLSSYQGDNKRAELFYAAARNRFENLEMPAGVAQNFFNLVEQFVYEGRLDLAERQCRSGITIFQEFGEESRQAAAWATLGQVQSFSGQITAATESLDKAEMLYGKEAGRGRVLRLKARLLQEQGRPAEALARLDEALALPLTREERFLALVQRAEALGLKDGPARESLQQGIELAEQLDRELFYTGDRSAAVAFALYRATVYEKLAQTFLNEGQTEKALVVVERQRERQLMPARFRLGPPQTKELEDLMELRRRYQLQLERAVDSEFATELRALQSEVDLRAGELEGRLLPELPAISELRRKLPPSAALLEYAVLGDRVHLFVLDRGGLSHHPLNLTSTELVAWMVSTQGEITALGSLTSDLSEQLGSLLLGPASATVTKVEHLIIVPDDELHLLPFELLSLEEAPLISSHAVSYLNTAAELADSGAGKAPTRSLVMGTLNGQVGQVARLWHTDPGPGTLRAFKEQAAGAGRLHLATRAYVSHCRIPREKGFLELDHLRTLARNPLENAGVIFSDGALTALDILKLDLSPGSWVAVTACHPDAFATGLFGLKRAFKLAGADHLLITLWRVEEEGSRELLKALYGYLEQGKPAAEALRLAKNQLREEGRKASVWGAFVLVGR